MKRREFIKVVGGAAATMAAAARGLTLTGPSTISVEQGKSAMAALQLSHKGKPQVSTFSVIGLPSGITAKFSPTSCKGDCQTLFTVTSALTSTEGTYNLTVLAKNGSDTATMPIVLTNWHAVVQPPPPGGGGGGSNQRLGLHVTSDELAIWQNRAVNGPYKTAGDVQTNSPGDWDDITTRKTSFNSNPTADRWAGNQTGSCWTPSSTSPGAALQIKMLAAAFYALVKNDTTSAANVVDE